MIDLRNLRRRLLFAIPAIPIGWWGMNSNLSLVPPGSPYHVVPGMVITIALIIMGGFEYNRMLAVFFPRNAFWLGLVWLATELVLGMFKLSIPLRYSIFVLLLIVAFEAIVWGKKNSGRWRRASLSFSAAVFLYIAGVSILYLFDPGFQSFFKSYGPEMLSRIGFVLVIGSVFLCDTMAYFVGCTWGKHHYSNISPNKTVEGSIGGFVTAVVAYSVLWIFLRNPAYPWYLGIFMGLILGIFAQVGDLLVSLMKRYFGAKNASEILSGHGGVLDRFGSVFVAVPTLGLFLLAFATDDYVKTLDEYLRLLQSKQYEKAYDMTGQVDIACTNGSGTAAFGARAGPEEWMLQKKRADVVQTGKIVELKYWEKDSARTWECQSALGLRCFKMKLYYKCNARTANAPPGPEGWQTRFAWLSSGADSKIRVIAESAVGP
jgi:phosphatidate cytidylyltransferase